MIKGWPPETLANFIKLYERGDAVSEIAVAIGKSKKAVISKASLLAAAGGLRLRHKPFTKDDEARLLQEYDAAAATGALEALAKSMGRTKHFLSRKAKGLDLTSYNRPKPYFSQRCSAQAKERWATQSHPRGFAGKTHGLIAREKMGCASNVHWASLSEDERLDQIRKSMVGRFEKFGTLATPRFGVSWKAEWRTIGGRRSFFRSSWEANYARYLEWLKVHKQIAEWEHEPTTFWFEEIRRGTRSYLPDFRVTENDGRQIYHEVKGWMDDASKTKIRRMAIYYPEVTLIVIDSRGYSSIARKVGAMIPDWETGARRKDAQGELAIQRSTKARAA